MLPYLPEKFGNAGQPQSPVSAGEAEKASIGRAIRLPRSSAASPRKLFSPAAPPSRDNLGSRRVSKFYKDYRATTSSPASPSTGGARQLPHAGAQRRATVLILRSTSTACRPRGRSQKPSPTRPCSSRSCTPTMRSARFIRSEIRQECAKEKGVIFHSTSRPGRRQIPLDVEKDGHRHSLCHERAQKFYGPQGRRCPMGFAPKAQGALNADYRWRWA